MDVINFCIITTAIVLLPAGVKAKRTVDLSSESSVYDMILMCWIGNFHRGRVVEDPHHHIQKKELIVGEKGRKNLGNGDSFSEVIKWD